MKKDKIRLVIFFTLYFVFNVFINVIHPVSPKYIDSLNIPEYWFGLFYAAMSLGQVVGALFWGFLSDKIGRKWIIVTGILGYAAAQAGFGFINQWVGLIIVFRILSGIFASAPVTLFVSMTIDFSNEKSKARNLMILSSFAILGSSVGYEIGGLAYNLLNESIPYVFIVQIVLGVVIALIFALTIKDVIREPITFEAKKAKAKFSFKNFANLNWIIYILLIALFILTVGQVLINKYFDIYLTHINYSPDVLGHYILITGVVAAIANLVFIPFIKKARNLKLAILLLSFIGVSAGLTYITFLVKVDNFMYLLFTTHMLYIVLKSMIMPLEQNEISSYCDNTNNGKIMGARQTILSLGNVIGPLIGAALYQKGNPMIFVAAASIILGSLLIYIAYFIIKYKRKAANQEQNERNI